MRRAFDGAVGTGFGVVGFEDAVDADPFVFGGGAVKRDVEGATDKGFAAVGTD